MPSRAVAELIHVLPGIQMRKLSLADIECAIQLELSQEILRPGRHYNIRLQTDRPAKCRHVGCREQSQQIFDSRLIACDLDRFRLAIPSSGGLNRARSLQFGIQKMNLRRADGDVSMQPV